MSKTYSVYRLIANPTGYSAKLAINPTYEVVGLTKKDADEVCELIADEFKCLVCVVLDAA
jgi:hypothetical protein